jgi:hypothetical protein
VQVRLEREQTGWVLPDDVDREPPVEPWAALLPALDPTTMGWKDRDFYVDPGFAPAVFDWAGNAGTTACWDGQIVGAHVQDDSGRIELIVPGAPVHAARAALHAEAERLGDWLDGEKVPALYSPAGNPGPLTDRLRRGVLAHSEGDGHNDLAAVAGPAEHASGESRAHARSGLRAARCDRRWGAGLPRRIRTPPPIGERRSLSPAMRMAGCGRTIVPVETIAFDLIYYGLAVGLAVVLFVVAMKGMRLRRLLPDRTSRSSALGVTLAAVGVEATLVAGVTLEALRPMTGDLLYQQVHFAIFYLGFALVLAGVDQVASSRPTLTPVRVWAAARAGVWIAYAGVVGLSVWLLANAGAAATAQQRALHHVPQQPAFFLPLLLVLGVSTVVLAWLATTRGAAHGTRGVVAWLSAFTGLVLVGCLREATIIPSSGEPLVDLLVAFGPFAAAGACLYLGLATLAFTGPARLRERGAPAGRGA